MAHEKVYGICEDKCRVEVYPKEQTYSQTEIDTKVNNIVKSKIIKLTGTTSSTSTASSESTLTFNFGKKISSYDVLAVNFTANSRKYPSDKYFDSLIYGLVCGTTNIQMKYKYDVQESGTLGVEVIILDRT